MEKAQFTLDRESPQSPSQHASPMISRTKCSCSGDGWILRDGKAYKCDCSIGRRLAACLPEKYRAARLKDFNNSIQSFVKSWLVRPTAGLFIFGSVGTGKTHLTAAILSTLLKAQADVAFQRAAQFFADLQESYRANTSSEAIVESLERPLFLILDDVGSGALSDHERRFTLELIERRVNHNRPTILTSNWSRQEIGEKMDARISSRLALFTELELSGADLREVHGDKPIESERESRPARVDATEEPLTEAERREFAEMTDSLNGRLGLLLCDKNGNTQTSEERLAELQRQKQFILQKYAEPEKGADNQPELQPAEVSVQ